MCRGENEPNGPYRCSADMQNALMSTKAHYAEAVQNLQTAKTQLETIATQTEQFREMVDAEGEDVSKQWIGNLEHLEQNQAEIEAQVARLEKKAGEWQQKLREAQRNYDSTRGGIQDLAQDYNSLLRLREEMETSDLYLPDAKERLDRKIGHIKTRIDNALGLLAAEREKPLEEEAEHEGATDGIETEVIDNTKNGESIPNGDESDNLIHPEVDAALDAMIDDLELSAVDKKYMGIIDPETGEEFDEHEIQVVSRKMRREARMRLKRQREADGNGREMLRSFLRSALYRAMRYNKATRHIVRLIGVKHYNDFLEKIDEIQFERKDRKLAKARVKWEKKRVDIANKEYTALEEIIQKDRAKYEAKIERATKMFNDGSISEEQYNYFKTGYENDMNVRIRKAELEQTEIDLLRSEWAKEEVEKIEVAERRAETIRQAMIERKRQREKMQELLEPLGA